LAAQTSAANGWYYMNWLANDDNPEYHRRVTGPAIVQSIARQNQSLVDAITIGTLMVLVPGMALTNAMREIMAGDIISGVNRTAEAILTATAISLGVVISLAIGM